MSSSKSREGPMYKYKTVHKEVNERHFARDLDEVLNDYAAQGWRLFSTEAVRPFGGPSRVTLVFEREVDR